MLNLDPPIFSTNLLKTQQFCQEQMSYVIEAPLLIDRASVFRGFNPEINGRELFEYGIGTFGSPDNKPYKTVGWTTDPLQHDWFVGTLLQDQMAYKDACLVKTSFQSAYNGEIIISRVDETVLDGASAVSSYYLFDDYDLPPIDTWFYLTSNNKKRLLFAWIPHAYMYDANEAVDVNCMDCIGWFKDWYPEEYKQYYLLAH
jgi:hypothetical protein